MTEPKSAKAWANDLSVLLKARNQDDRFPVDVKTLALSYSAQRYPNDPIVSIRGDNLPGFEGGLYQAEGNKKGWGIIFNSSVQSSGRINFTLAHEFGHYLLHRIDYPNGISCNDEDMARWGSEYGEIESQANDFAATLLMPFDDFRDQIGNSTIPDIDMLSVCADRYGVSLLAVILRWLEYTSNRSMLVVSRDSYILWARSSKSALKSGLYFKTQNRPPIEVPVSSLAVQGETLIGGDRPFQKDKIIWLNEQCKEEALFSKQYDFTISLLHFDDRIERYKVDEESDLDAYDKLSGFSR